MGSLSTSHLCFSVTAVWLRKVIQQLCHIINIAFKAWPSKSNRNSCWKIFLQVVVPDKFRRNNKVPDKILTSTMKLGTFIIIPEVCLRIFPNFPSTEVAFEWCSAKLVVLQKSVMECSYYTLVVKSLEK